MSVLRSGRVADVSKGEDLPLYATDAVWRDLRLGFPVAPILSHYCGVEHRRNDELGGIEDYQGRLINADPTGMNLVFPSAAPPHMASIDRGWSVELMYSTDGGKTFSPKVYMDHSFHPFDDSKDYIVAATKDKLFIAQKYQYRSDMPDSDLLVNQFPLNPKVDLNQPYPPGFDDDHAWKSKKKLMPDNLRTPSGDDRIHCDASIKPTNPDAPLIRDEQ